MDNNIVIGILDDDSSKSLTLEGLLPIKSFSNDLKEKYNKYNLIVQTLAFGNETTNQLLLAQVDKLKIDCILIDYKLCSYNCAEVNNGIEFARELLNQYDSFPMFIMTSYEGELFDNEIFKPEQVIDYSIFTKFIPGEKNEYRDIMRGKMIELVLNYRKETIAIKECLYDLLPQKGTSAYVDSKILELDSKLEKRINGKYSLPIKLKKDLQTNRFEELFIKIDELLKTRWFYFEFSQSKTCSYTFNKNL